LKENGKKSYQSTTNWMCVSINIKFVEVFGFGLKSKNLRDSDIFLEMEMIPILNKFVGHLFAILC